VTVATESDASAIEPADVPGVALAASGSIAARWLGRVDYATALALQQKLARANATLGDQLLLLEHDPVYTTGRAGLAANLGLVREGATGEWPPLLRIGRGGDVTYHGPGQLVGYAIVDLKRRQRDAHRFLRQLESGVISTLSALGVAATRWAGRTGVWVTDPEVDPGTMTERHMQDGTARKIASIGIAVRGGVTLHGFALNVAMDLSPFDAIVPCGLGGVHMTTVERETGRKAPAVDRVAVLAAERVAAALGEPADATARAVTT
jgi:lipoyl(octanoyl) transferase